MNKRFQEMDIMRGIAIIAVIVIHITSSVTDGAKNEMTEIFALFLNQLTRFAVPIFLILSGWGLTISKKYKMGYLIFLKSQLSKIIIFYLTWSIFYYVVTAESLSILGMIQAIIFGVAYYHLYYIPLIIFFYLIYPFIYKYAQLNYFLMTTFFITILSQYADFITNNEIFNSGLNIFNWLFFFVFGIWFAHDFNAKVVIIKKHTRLLLWFFIVAISVVFAEAYMTIDELGKSLSTTSMRPSVIMLSIAFFMMVIAFEWKNNMIVRIILNLSNVSYGIYLSHALILAIFRLFWAGAGFNSGSINYMASALFIVTPISYLIGAVMNNIEHWMMSIFNRKLVIKL